MCQEAIVNNAKGRVFPRNMRELAAALNIKVSRIPIKQGYRTKPRPELCFCPVDFKRLANLRGLTMIRHYCDDDYMGEIELKG